MTDACTSTVTFYRLINEGRPPQRADKSGLGLLPTRAARYCHAVTAASGFGWWAFPPMDLTLLWDGADIYWRRPSTDDWMILLPSAQFPGMAERFDDAAPAELAGASPPFLTALPEPGMLQIWTGMFARTAPGWSLLTRAPANIPAPGGVSLFEGIVETDRYLGAVFVNLRFTRSHKPVRLRADYPLAQLQPLPRAAYADETLNAVTVASEPHLLSVDDWEAFGRTVKRDQDRPFGAYAAGARRRAKAGCPFG